MPIPGGNNGKKGSFNAKIEVIVYNRLSFNLLSQIGDIFRIILVPLLQQIIEAAKHSELLRRVEYQLDELARAHHQLGSHYYLFYNIHVFFVVLVRNVTSA